MLVEFDLFQGGSGKWYINCPKRVGKVENQWWYPARRMNMELDNFVKMLVDDFHVNNISFNSILLYSWDDRAAANKFKLFLNKKAREGKWTF